MDERRGGPGVVGADRRRFFGALGLFLAWVVALGAMAAFSGLRPEPSPPAVEERRGAGPSGPERVPVPSPEVPAPDALDLDPRPLQRP